MHRKRIRVGRLRHPHTSATVGGDIYDETLYWKGSPFGQVTSSGPAQRDGAATAFDPSTGRVDATITFDPASGTIILTGGSVLLGG